MGEKPLLAIENTQGAQEIIIVDSEKVKKILLSLQGKVNDNGDLYSKLQQTLANKKGTEKYLKAVMEDITNDLEGAKAEQIASLTATLGLKTLPKEEKEKQEIERKAANATKINQETAENKAQQELAQQAQKLATTQKPENKPHPLASLTGKGWEENMARKMENAGL